jgi:uncharacterized protein YoxC
MSSKKNKSTKYTPSISKFERIYEVFTKVKEIFIILATVFLWLLGVWVTGKLAPLSEDIRTNSRRIDAMEYELKSCKNNYDIVDNKLDKIAEDVAFIKGKITE